jgi:hypothetical protein
VDRAETAEGGAGRVHRRLFGKEQSLEFPARAHRALEIRSELGARFGGLNELAGDPAKPVTADDIAQARSQHPRADEGG